MNRRLVLACLAVAALGLLAGCSAAGSLDMTAVNDTALADQASYSTDEGGFSPGAIYRKRAEDVIENGSATILAPEPPMETDRPYEHRGAYYNLTDSIEERVPGAMSLVSIDYNESSPNGTRLQFADLSSADRRELEPLLSASPPRFRDGAELDDLVVYTEAERSNSTLAEYADGYVTVVYDGKAYEIQMRPMRDEELRRYRYEATQVAGSAEAFATQLKNAYAFTLSSLNKSERNVVSEAIADGYYADSTDDAAFASLVERFRRHEAVRSDDYSGDWLVRYDGQLYWAEMDYGQFVEDGGETVTPPSATPN
jgi:hypothetical protein